MPYVPVQRDEGRILYQSTMDRAKLMGDTLTNLGETLYKREEENKAFQAKNSALKQLILANKEQFGLDEATAKQFVSGDINKSAKENYLALASFLEGNVMAANLKKQEDELKNTQAQRALAFAQTANQQASAEETRLKNQAMESARRELASEAMNLNAPVQRATPAAPPESVTQFLDTNKLMPAGTPFDPRANQMIAGYAEKPQAVAPARPLIGDADIKKQARIAQLTEQSSTGVMKPLAVYEAQINASLLKQKQDLRAQEAAERADVLAQRTSEAEMTQPQAMKQAEALNKQYPDSVFTVEPGANARSYVIKQSAKPDTLEKQKAIAFEAEMKPAVAALNAVSANAETARSDLPRQQRIFEALKEQAVTGYGAPLSIKVRSMLSDTGLINKKRLGRDQVFAADLALDALQKTKELLNGQGSVSNAERDRVDQVSLNIEKDPSAIEELMLIHEAATKRAIAAEEQRSMLYDKSKRDDPYRLIDINESMKKWYQKNTLTDFASEGKMFADELKRKAKEKTK